MQTRLDAVLIQQLQPQFFSVSSTERQVLRRLAGQVAELAARPIEEEKRRLWYAHNSLQPTRPVIFCDPENGWNEIIRPADLECEGVIGRWWEMRLRKEIFWGTQMGDDYTIVPYFDTPHVHTGGLEDWGLKEKVIGGEHGGSYVWEAPIRSAEDIQYLRMPQVQIDWPATHRLAEMAHDIFGDLLTVRIRTNWWWTLGMTMKLAHLRGLQQIMLDMVDNPELVHTLMSILRDGTLRLLEYLEREGLLSLNNDGSYVGSGGLGWCTELPQPDFDGRVRMCDMWGFAESQETVGVSPAMFAEFVFPYQLSILEHFGLNCYGCCEPLDKRWHVVQRIPRLRRVSVSPWANVADMAEKLGDRYIFSWKPSPTDLAMPFDEERIRAKIREAFRLTRNCRVEAIMKDNHTLGGDPTRVIRWCRVAREEAERV
ncbi:MAG: hypothetical protein DDG58_00380 [Ardenticatenia bacterium]|jgi:hypothetical protein|nr:MAG: hypothetical protein DDG58_00380 [Ardenticatenia bacterium]